MTEAQLRSLGPALDRFLDRFLFCCPYTQTFDHLATYCRGLLSDLPRKSVEPIALASGTPVRTLQEFVRDWDWDHHQVLDVAQTYAADLLRRLPGDELGVVGVVDETGQPKKGDQTPGVQRQWCGRLGKVDNCVVTVHLGVCKGRFKALLGGQLFLPQDWSADRDRCRRAGIPDEVHYRPKWQIALDQIDTARGNGVSLDWLTFDEGYGKHPEFFAGLDQRHLRFVGEVPAALACLLVVGDEVPADKEKSSPAECVLSRALAGPAVAVRIAREHGADEVWQAAELPVWVRSERSWLARSYRLILAYNARSGEMKYFLSNAAAEVELALVVRAGFRRSTVEQCFEVQKGELGFGHYEGRNYRGMLRHLALCCVAGLFAAERTASGQQNRVWLSVKQLLRGLRAVCAVWLRRRRGVGGLRAEAETIQYHQRRNEAAARCHKKRFALPTFWIVSTSRMSFYPPGLQLEAL
jgi:SRSO17 transposase